MHAAISDADGNVNVYKTAFGYNSAIEGTGYPAGNVQAVTMNSLMDKLNLDHIDLLKIDIEGYEKRLLANNIDWLNKVGYILIELHSEEDKTVCFDAFQRYKFKVEKLQANNLNDQLFLARRVHNNA